MRYESIQKRLKSLKNKSFQLTSKSYNLSSNSSITIEISSKISHQSQYHFSNSQSKTSHENENKKKANLQKHITSDDERAHIENVRHQQKCQNRN